MLCFKDFVPTCSFLLLFLLGLVLFSEGIIYQESLNSDDLESLFGDDDCVEGTLSVTESGDPIIKPVNYASIVQSHIFSTKPKKEDEITDDKSPVSLLYELAEFNQVKVQFTLTDEKGPAHKKQFEVSLKLGDEDYVGEGSSIKKAQHEVSKLALNSTLYGHPPKRIKNKIILENNKTPVQKLDTWAMKHTDAHITYTFFEQTQLMDQGPHANYYHSGMYSKANNIHKVNVKIGNHAFNGEGKSLETAKQDAANKALKFLQNADGICMLTDKEKNLFTKIFESDSDNDSPVSVIHEFGSISNMPVSFDLFSEEGPPHIKKYVFRCNVGDSFETFGEGSSKKIAKKEAAENMIQKLKKHTSFHKTNCVQMPKKRKSKRNKSRNLIKSVVKKYSEEEYENDAQYFIPEDLDPISKLFQIQQSKHDVLPVFTLLEKSNNNFSIEVTVGDMTSTGTGQNKKIAKKNAAQAMLEKMGYSTNTKKSQSLLQKTKNDFIGEESNKINIASGISINANELDQIKNVKDSGNKYVKTKYDNKNDHKSKLEDKVNNPGDKDQSKHPPQKKDHKSVKKPDLKPKSARDASQQKDHKLGGKPDLNPKSQLHKLSKQLLFKFQFSDFPKANNSGFVSLVSLTTDPAKVCCGVGVTLDQAQDKAALSALSTLYKAQIEHISHILQEDITEVPMKSEMTMIEEDNIVRSVATSETD